MATGAANRQTSTLDMNVRATGAIAARRFMNRAGAQAVAGENTLGVVDVAVASGETARVFHVGMAVVECGAILNGSERRLAADANGRAIAYATGEIVALLPPGVTSTAANQEISVILLPN